MLDTIMRKNPERRDLILDAALAIADRDGLDNLTLRKIEAETGLSAPLVYRHFKDKAAIVEGLGERLLLRSTPIETPPDDTRAWLEAVFSALYRNGRDHASWLALLSAVDPMQMGALAMTESVLTVLRAAGLDASAAGHAFQWLMAYTIGAVVLARGTQLKQEVLIEAISRMPMLAQSGPFLDPRNDAVFTRGLGAILDTVGVAKGAG